MGRRRNVARAPCILHPKAPACWKVPRPAQRKPAGLPRPLGMAASTWLSQVVTGRPSPTLGLSAAANVGPWASRLLSGRLKGWVSMTAVPPLPPPPREVQRREMGLCVMAKAGQVRDPETLSKTGGKSETVAPPPGPAGAARTRSLPGLGGFLPVTRASKEGSQGCTRACFPPIGHSPQVVAAGKEGGRSACAVAGEGPCVPAGASGPLCIIQLVNCLVPITAERAIELCGVIIYDEAQRCLPGTGTG